MVDTFVPRDLPKVVDVNGELVVGPFCRICGDTETMHLTGTFTVISNSSGQTRRQRVTNACRPPHGNPMDTRPAPSRAAEQAINRVEAGLRAAETRKRTREQRDGRW